MEVKSIQSDQTVDSINPLFSTILTLYITIFLYFPTIFKNLFISPIFIFTLILLVYLLRLGTIQKQLEFSKSIEPQKQEFTYSSPSLYFPPTPQRFGTYDDNTEFAFCFNGQVQIPSLSADELFDAGKMKTLKLLQPCKYQHNASNSPKSPRSPKRMLSKSVLVVPKRDHSILAKAKKEEDEKSSNCSSCSNSSSRWSRKWKLFTFSDGNAINKRNGSESEFIRKKNPKEDRNEWSFRSWQVVSGKSCRGGGACRKKGRVSAHEWHYMKNRAEMRKKTFLPYKKNLLGCMDHVDTGVLAVF